MKRKNIIATALGIFALVLIASAPVAAQDQKDDLETFRTDLVDFWKPLADNTKLLLAFASGAGLPVSEFYTMLPSAAADPVEIEAAIAALSTEELQELKRQFDMVQGWQQFGTLLRTAIPPDVRAGLAAFGADDRPFPETNSFASAVCSVVEGLGLAETLQGKQTFSQVAVGLYETLEAIAIPFDVACDASPCSIFSPFDLAVVNALKISMCSVATGTRIAAVVGRAIVDAAQDCTQWTFYNGVQQRVDFEMSKVASADSVGQLTCCGFNGETIHEKLEDRFDIVATSRSTQDSIDGARLGRPPSQAKSLRSVVDHTDQVRLPDLERTIDETLELAKKQGELMRDFRDLLIRMQIETDLIDRGKSFREALFQLPDPIPGHKRAFCARDIVVPCLAPGPDLAAGTNDDVPDAALCPDDSQPAEFCNIGSNVCSQTRAAPCVVDGDCPGSETCDTTSHPCSASPDRECSFDEDCPTGRPKQVCVEADRQRGFFDLVRQIVEEALDMTTASGEEIHKANDYLARADALVAAGDYKNAYSDLRLAYQEAARMRTGH